MTGRILAVFVIDRPLAALFALAAIVIPAHFASAERQAADDWHPQRDSNPCRHLERVVS
jgi:hypothetical protein